MSNQTRGRRSRSDDTSDSNAQATPSTKDKTCQVCKGSFKETADFLTKQAKQAKETSIIQKSFDPKLKEWVSSYWAEVYLQGCDESGRITSPRCLICKKWFNKTLSTRADKKGQLFQTKEEEEQRKGKL